LGFAATNAQIEEVTNTVDRLMKWVCVANGLPAASMSVDPSVESGISKIIGNVELEESRRDDISLWRTYEKRVFSVLRTVWNAHNSRKLSDACTLAVDFADRSRTPAKRSSPGVGTSLEHGACVSCGLHHGEEPDITSREDAMAYLFQIKEEVAALNENKI
jgi:hypothetical protein